MIRYHLIKAAFYILFIFKTATVFSSVLELHNPTDADRTFSLRFLCRVLIQNNEPVTAPDAYTLSLADAPVSPLEFGVFERRNLDVFLDRHMTLKPGETLAIPKPFPLTQSMEINTGDASILIDLDQLFYQNADIKGLMVRFQSNIETLKKTLRENMAFAKSHCVVTPAEEDKKPHHYLKNPAPYIRRVLGAPDAKVLDGISHLEERSLGILSGVCFDAATEEGFPFISHRVWLTDPFSPMPPSEDQIEHTILSAARLNLKNSWRHMVWCWDASQIRETCTKLQNCGQNIEIIEISKHPIFKNMFARHLFLAAFDHGLFTLAGNILRNNLLYFMGGFYADMGAELHVDPTPLFQKADVVAHWRRGRVDKTAFWIDHDFMAAKPMNPMNRRFLERVHTLHELAGHGGIRAFFTHPRLMHSWSNARLLTEIFQIFAKEDGIQTLIMPDNESAIAVHHKTSWYGAGDGKSCQNMDETTLNWFNVGHDYAADYEPLISHGFPFHLYRKHFYAPTDPLDTMPTFQKVARNFTSQGTGVIPFEASPERPQPVVVTLTSWPPKIQKSVLAIESILRQTLKPNRVILWLAEDEFPDGVPPIFDYLKGRGLEVQWCENIKSFKKLIPALRDPDLQDSVLISADDDIVYKPDWLQSLHTTHLRSPHAVVAHRARVMQWEEDGEAPKPYATWELAHEGTPKSAMLLPTGCGGILFPPKSLNDLAMNASIGMTHCPTGDDIFWFGCALLNGTPILMPDAPQKSVVELNDEEDKPFCLWTANKHGKNDEMLHSFFSAHNIWQFLKR